MSEYAVDVETYSSSIQSNSMESSFQILSRDSDTADNDVDLIGQRNHISLEEQDDSAPCHSEEETRG